MTRSDQLTALGALIVLGAIIGLSVVFWPAPQSDETPSTVSPEKLVSPDSAMTGVMTAKVTLVEWGDFQCPACGAVAPTLEQVIAKYGANKDFNFVFRHFPLPQHANAVIASEAAVAAGAQKQFWGMYNALYNDQNGWSLMSDPRAKFDEYAKTLGLDLAAFDAALEKHTFSAFVTADKQAGVTLGLNHTPTIYLNGVEQTDVSLAALVKAIDVALVK